MPRQPVHTVYGGAHLFTEGICQKLGGLALKSLDANGPYPDVMPEVMELVRRKLERNRLRTTVSISRTATEIVRTRKKDRHAEAAAKAVAVAMRDGLLPPFIGIRIKPLTEAHRSRTFRTLELFLAALLEHSGGKLPPNFVVTLPKVESPAEPAALFWRPSKPWRTRFLFARWPVEVRTPDRNPASVAGAAADCRSIPWPRDRRAFRSL